jgi:hypothetical protein
MSDFLDPKPEDQNIVLIGEHLLRRAEKLIVSCEVCSPHYAETSFDRVLDRVTGNDPAPHRLYLRNAGLVSTLQAAD